MTPLHPPKSTNTDISPDAKVTKRPLHRPAIPSPYAGASQQKIVYISSKTPFLSAVKRVEKLLSLADKRLVQSATTLAKQRQQSGRKRGGGGGDAEDEILGIAREVESLKAAKRRKTGAGGGSAAGVRQGEDREDEGDVAGEEVVLKGTGKAISRVLEMALWFQQRGERFVVRMTTGTVTAIDDIEVGEDGSQSKGDGDGGEEGDGDGEHMPETRLRRTNVLEVAVSLK